MRLKPAYGKRDAGLSTNTNSFMLMCALDSAFGAWALRARHSPLRAASSQRVRALD